MDDLLLNIEEIRRRAKDNKAKNTEYFLTLSFKTLDRFRNLLITLSVVGFGFFQTTGFDLTNKTCVLSLLFLSVLFGIISYVTSLFSTMYESSYYSNLDKIFSQNAFPTQKEYADMIEKENTERDRKNNFWWPISFFMLSIQTIFLLCALKSVI